MNIDLTSVGLLLTALGVGSVLVAIINTFLSPKARAEAKQIARGTAREEIDLALDTLRADVNDARARATASEARADETDRKHDALLAQYREAITHLWRLQLWAHRYYQAGHPPGMEPPPIYELQPDGGHLPSA